jgi:hypothetical protein
MRRSVLAGLAAIVVAFLLVSDVQAADADADADADAYSLAGAWVNKGESAEILIVKQVGTAITWQAIANNKLRPQSFSGVLKRRTLREVLPRMNPPICRNLTQGLSRITSLMVATSYSAQFVFPRTV